MNTFFALAALHAAVTWYLVGLIWVIQRVHYPSMLFVEPSQFSAFEAQHCQRIGQIVAPAMLVEGCLAAALLVWSTGPTTMFLSVLGLVLGATIWISTAWIQVPLHARLQLGSNPVTIGRLVQTNWIRTLAWTLRGCVALGMLFGS